MTDFPSILRRLGDALDGMELPLAFPVVRLSVSIADEDVQRAVLRVVSAALPGMKPRINLLSEAASVDFGSGLLPPVTVTVSRSLVTDEPMPDPEVRVRTFAEVIA